METLPAPRPADPAVEIAALAQRFHRANGPVISLVNAFGGSLERYLTAVPAPLRDRVEGATTRALELAFGVAAQGDRVPGLRRGGSVAAVMATGAAGGAGGLPTALAELPVTITVMLHAIRQVAAEAGYDPDDPAIKAECLTVFAAGSPLSRDDGVNTAFLSSRLALSGPTMRALIARVAPRLAAALAPKLAAQSVPVLGAVAGAALNAAFLNYYREIARIRFALYRLSETHGAERVLARFAQQVDQKVLR